MPLIPLALVLYTCIERCLPCLPSSAGTADSESRRFGVERVGNSLSPMQRRSLGVGSDTFEVGRKRRIRNGLGDGSRASGPAPLLQQRSIHGGPECGMRK